MILQSESAKRLNAALRRLKKSKRPALADATVIRWARWCTKVGCR